MDYGYVRVLSKEQNIARQMEAMGIERKKIFVDMQSGKNFNRPAYKKLLRKVKPGDVIVIKSIDRLGRNYDEILEQWRVITKLKQVDIYVLDFPLLDTRKRIVTLLVHSSLTLFYRFFLIWRRQSVNSFIRDRQRG